MDLFLSINYFPVPEPELNLQPVPAWDGIYNWAAWRQVYENRLYNA